MSSVIRSFWRELEALLPAADAEGRIAAAGFAEEVGIALSRVHRDLHWEIGPEDRGQWFFAVSPGHCEELVGLAREIVRAAPDLPGWTIKVFRQRKPDWSTVWVHCQSRGQVEFNTTGWRYGADLYAKEGFMDILLQTEKEDDPLIGHAATVMLDSALGEEIVMRHIGRLEVVPTLGKRGPGIPVHLLRDHMADLIKEHGW